MAFFNNNTPNTKKGTTKGFYFGKPEAEAEFSMQGQTLIEYFEDFLDVKSKIGEGRFIISGRKGVGKSAIAQHFINAASDPDNDLYTIKISPKDIELNKLIQGLPDVDISLFFEWSILTKLIKLLIGADLSDTARHISDLKKFYERNSGVVNIANYKIEEMSLKTEVGIDVFRNKFSGIMARKIKDARLKNAPFYDFIPILREILQEVLAYDIYKECTFLLEFDELDVDFKVRRDSDKILKLIRVAREYNTNYFKNSPFKLLIFIRDDIKDYMSSSDKTKLFDSYEYNISWYNYDTHIRDEKEILLRKFINKRIQTNFDRLGLTYNRQDPWSSLFDPRERKDGKTLFEYILDYTFYRPRDFVNLLSPLGQLEYNYPLNGSAVTTLINKMAQCTMGDVEDELSILYERDYIQSIKRLLRDIAVSHPPVSYTKIIEIFKNNGVDIDVLDVLIDYDIIILSKNGNFHHKYREHKIEDKVENYEFSLHKAIYVYFSKLR